MASTPEGKVKAKVKSMLAEFGMAVYSHWPVQNGMGKPTLDCIICAYGFYIAIETKVEGKNPTPRQQLTISEITLAKGLTFVVRNERDVDQVRQAIRLLGWTSANNSQSQT